MDAICESGWVVQVEVDEDARMDDADPEYLLAFVSGPATDDGIGRARFYISGDGERAVISGEIYVDEDYRRRGVATALAQHIHSFTGLPVDPNGFTHAGLGLWRSLGWSSFGH